eukprot:TRINITY_DN53814_c0_g1_i1.p1 TRINITY_DN53814_c0_g1~~TRINITY_DN53814_c0_g1_i1.p1  ORF type:complete len:495 (-),score=116.98 TRINITY_DN53814_c0_g1_i1:634-2118(-)
MQERRTWLKSVAVCLSFQLYLGSAAGSSWLLSQGNWRDGKVTDLEKVFISRVKYIARRFAVKFAYDLYAPGYVWDHVMPIFHVFPGKLLLPDLRLSKAGDSSFLNIVGEQCMHPFVEKGWCDQHKVMLKRGFNESDVMYATQDEVNDYIAGSVRHVILSTGGDDKAHIIKWGVKRSKAQVVHLSHGTDEDHIWRGAVLGRRQGYFPSILFTRFMGQTRRLNPRWMSANMRPGLPIIYYIATFSGGDLRKCRVPTVILPRKGCEEPAFAVVSGLKTLAHSYNIIIRPHPLDIDTKTRLDYLRQTFPNCIIDDYKDGNSPVALAELAEVIIAEPSSLITSLLFFLKRKPIVYLVRDWQRYTCARDYVINDAMAEVFFPDSVNSTSAFLYAVARAKAFAGGPGQEEARRKYVKLYYGDLDGFEEYRVVVMILRYCVHGDVVMERQVDRLEADLKRFSQLDVPAPWTQEEMPGIHCASYHLDQVQDPWQVLHRVDAVS